MFTYIPIVKESLSKQTIIKYSKYQGASELFESKAFSILKEEYLLDYIEALEKIFPKYNLNGLHLSDILYIIGQHIFIYSTNSEKRIDALEASETLFFLKNYHLQNEELKQKFDRLETQVIKDLDRFVQFETPNYKTEYPIKLHNVHFIAKGIYKLFKSQSYIHLSDILNEYDEIPCFEIVDEMARTNQYIIDYPDRYFLAQLTIDLLNYFDSLVPKVSNKHRLTFDLLFVSQLFHLNTKADKDIEALINNNRFDLSGIRPTFKTSYMKGILKAYKIYIKRNS